jgi:hypothetical protein
MMMIKRKFLNIESRKSSKLKQVNLEHTNRANMSKFQIIYKILTAIDYEYYKKKSNDTNFNWTASFNRLSRKKYATLIMALIVPCINNRISFFFHFIFK